MRRPQPIRFGALKVGALFMFGNAMWVKLSTIRARVGTTSVPFEPDTIVEA